MLYLSKIDNIKFYKPQRQLFQNDKIRCRLIFIGALLVVIALLIWYRSTGIIDRTEHGSGSKSTNARIFATRDEINQIFNLLTLQLGNDVMVAN